MSTQSNTCNQTKGLTPWPVFKIRKYATKAFLGACFGDNCERDL